MTARTPLRTSLWSSKDDAVLFVLVDTNRMPRNLRGGKAFKKGSKGKAKEAAAAAEGGGGGGAGRYESPDRTQGVDFARVLRALGNRRMLCFCNDGVERVCKIRGALCKGPRRKKIEEGDIVLVSYRAYMEGTMSYALEESDSDEELGSLQHVGVTTFHKGGAGGTDSSTSATGGAATLDSGRKDIADIVHKYESRDWRYIRKEGSLHVHLFGERKEVAGGAGGVGDMDDIFDDRGGDDSGAAGGGGSGSGSGSDSGDDDGDIDIDAI